MTELSSWRTAGLFSIFSEPVSGNPVGSTWGEDRLKYYLINPVTYGELIALADKEITGYSPDERVKEKYGLE